MIDYLANHPEAIAAFLSALATGFAAWSAWIGPMAAAKAAEKLRRQNDETYETRRLKLWIFTTLMQERAYMASIDAVRALNLVDVVFRDAVPVREAWAELFAAYGPENKIPDHVRQERLRHLLKEMASDIGIADTLRGDDLGRVYYPEAIAEEELLRQMERKVSLTRLQAQLNPTANAAPEATAEESPWPPRPA